MAKFRKHDGAIMSPSLTAEDRHFFRELLKDQIQTARRGNQPYLVEKGGAG